jgi:DNA polymerase III subunit chi
MAETTVFFVETKSEEQPLVVCRWVERFYDQGKRVQVLAGSSPAAQNLDHLLWTFAQGSFIPHRIASSGVEVVAVEPVIITLAEIPVSDAAVLVCDGPTNFEFLLRYELVVHFVLLDDAEKRLYSRSLWQRLRDRGVRTTHIPYASTGRSSSS